MRKLLLLLLALFLSITATISPASYHITSKITPKRMEQGESLPSDSLSLSSGSAVLMEASTGTILYEKDSATKRPPASVTKVMSMLLIFDAISSGKIRPSDPVTVSEHAAGMGGSQVFLEVGEIQTVETLLKCISIASANDAVVALAEHVSGSEESFVQAMNEKAAALGMKHTNFVNCCGLDDPDHYTSAIDIALMTRELITKHPEVFNYCGIWQEDITHTTRKGSSLFTLTNTNKLLKQYPYATGLKTGSTSQAKFCLSATATKDHMTLIAVIMAAENSRIRFAEATKLLEYGFSATSIYSDEIKGTTYTLPVKKGASDTLQMTCQNNFCYLSRTAENLSQVEKKTKLPKEITAPVKKGDAIGEISYYLNGQQLGSIPLCADQDIEKAHFTDYYRKLLLEYLP